VYACSSTIASLVLHDEDAGEALQKLQLYDVVMPKGDGEIFNAVPTGEALDRIKARQA